jgi:hypothetical protein
MTLLDGVTETRALMQRSGLGALKRTSAQKLIARARGLIDQVVGAREGFL